MPLRVLHVASELFPYAKTGGLADVVAALPVAQRRLGIDARVLIPGYPGVLDAGHGLTVRWTEPNLFDGGPARVYSGKLRGSELPIFVLDCPGHFMRSGGFYSLGGRDWSDNYRRFGALGWVAAQFAQGLDSRFGCDVIHAHDWQGALALAYLALHGVAARRVATIHNIAYSGSFDLAVAPELRLPPEALSVDGVEFYGRLSFLKAALYYAHKITTVSPTYAKEIQGQEQGGGFDGLLRARSSDLVGILNGVDYAQWNPAADPHLVAAYDRESLPAKARVRQALRTELGLPNDPGALLLGVVSRLAWQKGIDLITALLPWLAEQRVQLAILGTGEAHLAERLQAAAATWSDRVSVRVSHDEGLAHRIIAGADALLMPSRSEPCGLTQMYALRYGTPPIVRRTGGLADTVRDVDATPDGTGFVFEAATREALCQAVTRATAFFDDRSAWARLQERGMREDFGWERAARSFEQLYLAVPGRSPSTRPRRHRHRSATQRARKR